MTVLLTDGNRKLLDTFHYVLDTFLSDADFKRGVFIKPNIVFPVKASSGEITPPSLVKTLIRALRERHSNLDIIIGEGVAAGCDPMKNFQASGFTKLASELNVPLIDLHCTERKTVSWKFGRLALPSVVFERVYINLPKLKPSSACVISGALKNQKGLVLPEMKKHFHRLGLHEQIAELNRVVQPSLTIMDCSGFFGRNVLISGNNCGEIDSTTCQLLGIDEPEHIKLSRSAGVFTPGYSITGDLGSIKLSSARPMVREFKRIGGLRLWSNPQACTMCRYLFHDIQQDFLKRQNLSRKVKLLTHSIKGAEIIMGLNPQWQKEYDTVICVGTCTRNIAKEGDYIHIPGCPPTLDDFYDNLPE
jgi:uncharacterized protein (DUF362 family)